MIEFVFVLLILSSENDLMTARFTALDSCETAKTALRELKEVAATSDCIRIELKKTAEALSWNSSPSK